MRDRENVMHVKLTVICRIVEKCVIQNFLELSVILAQEIVLARDKADLKRLVTLGERHDVIYIFGKPLLFFPASGYILLEKDPRECLGMILESAAYKSG